MDRAIVVGGGSAGFLAALALKKTHQDLIVTVVKSEKIPIIGVGEATTWQVPNFLHNFLGLDRAAFFREAHPTWKGGVRLEWGKRPYFDYTFEHQMSHRPGHGSLRKNVAYYCNDDFKTASIIRATMDLGRSPILRMANGDWKIAGSIGYHIENETFVAHLERRAAEMGVEIVEAMIASFEKDPTGDLRAARLEDGRSMAADLFVDCSGFRSRLLRDEMGVPFRSFARSLFCDRAIVGGWPRGADEPVMPYTGSKTMTAGWTFVTEHWERVNCGYVFSSSFISDEAAEQEFRAFAGGKLTSARFVPYVSGRTERAWAGNVVAIGNSCGFVEPLQSTGLHVICDMSVSLAGLLVDCDRAPNEGIARQYNRVFAKTWDEIRAFLAMHYKLNDRLETPFWRAARADTDLAGAEEVLRAYEEGGPSSFFSASFGEAGAFFGYDGFLTLFVGMNAPTRHRFHLSAAEAGAWREVVARTEREAERALPMRESFEAVTSEWWRWDAGAVDGVPLHPAARGK